MRKFDNSDRLYARALKTIPTGAQTFSKSAQMMVRGASPLFLERANGARVWDVDGNEYLDFILGLLPVVLGHCDPDVDAAIRAQMSFHLSHLNVELELVVGNGNSRFFYFQKK